MDGPLPIHFGIAFGKQNFCQYLFKFMAKKASYEVNCKIQFTNIICAKYWRIFIQKYINQTQFILEFDLRSCPPEWNQANALTYLTAHI